VPLTTDTGVYSSVFIREDVSAYTTAGSILEKVSSGHSVDCCAPTSAGNDSRNPHHLIRHESMALSSSRNDAAPVARAIAAIPAERRFSG
jgi:hypothetical protein